MSLTQDLLGQVLSSQGLSQLAKSTGLSENQVRQIAGAGLPTILQGLVNNAGKGGSSATNLERALLQHGYNYSSQKANPYDYLNKANIEDGQKILGHVFGPQKSTQLEDYLAKQTGANKKQTGSILGTLAPLALAVLGGKFIMDGGLDKVLGKSTDAADTTSTSTSSNDGGLFGQIASSAQQLFGDQEAPTDESGGLLHSIGSLFGPGASETSSTQETQPSSNPLADGLMSLLGGSSDSGQSVTSTAKSVLGADENNNGIPDLLEGLQSLFK